MIQEESILCTTIHFKYNILYGRLLVKNAYTCAVHKELLIYCMAYNECASVSLLCLKEFTYIHTSLVSWIKDYAIPYTVTLAWGHMGYSGLLFVHDTTKLIL